MNIRKLLLPAFVPCFTIPALAGNSDTPSVRLGFPKEVVNIPNEFGDRFGEVVDLSGDTLIVGVPRKRPTSTLNGAVYFFERNRGGADSWGEAAFHDDAFSILEGFGQAVAIDGDTAAIGAGLVEASPPERPDESGAVFIHERAVSFEWYTERIIFPPGGKSGIAFGASVALCGDLLAVGAPLDDTAGTDAGAIYVFERNTGGRDEWGHVATLTDPLAGSEYRLGETVAIDNETVVGGSPGNPASVHNTTAGQVLVFRRNLPDPPGQGPVADNWGYEARIPAPDANFNSFGNALALEGDLLVVGQENFVAEEGESGAAFVFQRRVPGAAGLWTRVATLVHAVGSDGADGLGHSVDISGDIVVAGEPGDGAVHHFHRNHDGPDAWGVIEFVSGSVVGFGDDVAIDGRLVAVGSPEFLDGDRNIVGGRVQILELQGEEWVPTVSSLVERHAADLDELAALAEDVDIHGDTAIIGGRGYAYLLRRNHDPEDPGTPAYEEWGMVKKLEPPDGAPEGSFGRRVSITDAYAVVADESGVSLYDRDFDPSDPALVARDGWGLRERREIATEPGDELGDVALDKDKLLVGLLKSDLPGRALFFYQNEGGADQWGQVVMVYSGGADPNSFGRVVDLSGNRAVVGAPLKGPGGFAYLLERNAADDADSWWIVTSLSIPGSARFGESVSIVNDTVAIGDSGFSATYPGRNHGGNVAIFERMTGGNENWGMVTLVTAPDAGPTDAFGASVSLAGDMLAVGAPGASADGLTDAGAFYVFQRNTGGSDAWGLTWRTAPERPRENGRWGRAVVTNGVHAVVGAPGAPLDEVDLPPPGEASILRWDRTHHWSWVESNFDLHDYREPLLYDSVWGGRADPDGDGLTNLMERAVRGHPRRETIGRGFLPRAFVDDTERGVRIQHDFTSGFPRDLRLRVLYAAEPGISGAWERAALLGRAGGENAEWEVTPGFSSISEPGAPQPTRIFQDVPGPSGFYRLEVERR